MIVNSGKQIIIQYFGGQVGQIGDYLAFGTGTTAPALTDTALGTEVYRVRCSSISADLANKRIVFKATVPASVMASFSEIGLFSNGGTASGGTLVSRVTFGTPQVPDAHLPTDIEYSLGINV